jgi:hypothetical protein
LIADAPERRIVVSDAGPLISLGRLDLLTLLSALFASVHVPQQVFDECQARPGQADAQRIRQAVESRALLLCEVEPIQVGALDLGERAAIGHALAIGAGLLADDRAARHYAQAQGLDVIGTLGILVLAQRRGLIAEIKTPIQLLRDGGQRLSDGAVAAALAAAGESNDDE